MVAPVVGRSTDETSSAYDTTEGRDETTGDEESRGLPAAAGPFGIELKVGKPPTRSDKSFQYSL